MDTVDVLTVLTAVCLMLSLSVHCTVQIFYEGRRRSLGRAHSTDLISHGVNLLGVATEKDQLW